MKRNCKLVPCPVCWGKKVICVGIDKDLEPSKFKPCPGCDGTGWLACKEEHEDTKIN